MTQTLALLLDSYRALNAKKLFWITLALSGLVVGAFASVGVSEKGLTLFGWQTTIPLNSAMMTPETFYKLMFTGFGISFWLAWIATILALVSTAGIFPDMITSGSVELVLSKPISRLRLFLTRYLTGLLFVTLQVSVFSVASLLVIGIRGHSWEPALLLAIPVVVIFFSYLFSVCTLFGLLTRSTIASLMLTLLVWFAFFGVGATENVMLLWKLDRQQRIEALQTDITNREAALTSADAASETGTGGVGALLKNALAHAGREQMLKRRRDQLQSLEKNLRMATRFHTAVFAVKTAAPKTTETIKMLRRWLVDLADLQSLNGPETDQPLLFSASDDPDEAVFNEVQVQQNVQKELVAANEARSPLWIVGTSLLFEAFVLGVCGWIFVRRDF